MIELASYAERLRRPGVEVPDFDPADGGIEARVLFLFEKPGPMTAAVGKGDAQVLASSAATMMIRPLKPYSISCDRLEYHAS
ncbi:hypothetical protein [Bradyrhizobium sp. JYMT SZCCT0428]|uniref:hypothetical protein n=1 Tax=Bradyrhizobium sp. JYMT SZCCT0428 TaxID=2807673 RepID=UPI001BAAEF8C|nr:hypothetical protein [Bradyrhizobium sp. JYMT SZCCT0428]